MMIYQVYLYMFRLQAIFVHGDTVMITHRCTRKSNNCYLLSAIGMGEKDVNRISNVTDFLSAVPYDKWVLVNPDDWRPSARYKVQHYMFLSFELLFLPFHIVTGYRQLLFSSLIYFLLSVR